MFKLGSKVSGVRPVKDDEGLVIITTTKGQIRFTPVAGAILGVNAGDYVEFRNAETEDGQKVMLVYADPNGSVKLASTSESGAGVLNGSTGNAWKTLGGNTEVSHTFKLGEVFEADGIKYFPLQYNGERAKAPRVATKKA